MQAIGCDGVLESAAVEDKCRICNGNGSNCHTVTGTLDTSLYPPGTNSKLRHSAHYRTNFVWSLGFCLTSYVPCL